MVEQVLDAAARRVQPHPRRRDALLEQRLAGAVERRCRPRSGRPPRVWTPCRSSPCTAGPRGRASGRPATRTYRRTRSRSSRWTPPRPARGPRRGGDGRRRLAHMWAPSRLAAAAHSTTAENCGRPTPVISRVVHMAPGPTPTLTIDAAGGDQVAGALRGYHVAGGDRQPEVERRHRLDRVEHLELMAVRGVDTSRSTPASARPRALAPTSPLMPTAAAMRSWPLSSTAGV